MVKVREDYPLLDDGSVDINGWLGRLVHDDENIDRTEIKRACELAKSIEEDQQQATELADVAVPLQRARVKVRSEQMRWPETAGSFLTGLDMIQILNELQLDTASLIAAVLYSPVHENRLKLLEVEKEFGKEVAGLVRGVLQMAAISQIQHPLQGSVLGQSQTQVDNIRRMLVTMIDDVRVALIKLAERTCAIRAVKEAGYDRRHRIAREVFDIYAPLAHRLGIGFLKWELEDLSFRYLHEKAYKKIAKLLDERRLDRQRFILDAIATLRQELSENGIRAELAGRAKHIYSIWRKMHRKGIDFEQVYDIRAIRILVPTIKDCYSALGIVHGRWRHIPHEFDDYIANPKENGYQSLHTAVLGPSAKVMEVQIRTYKMHEESELGVCAHWRYKGHDVQRKSSGYEDKISWLRQVLEWQELLGAKNSDVTEQFQNEIVSDRIYVFTPDGHVIDFPAGATPVDFAYKVHTEVGHSCRGAKVNGVIKPLNYALKTGDQVHILTSNKDKPSRDWLNPDLGYTRTSRARAKITHWFKEQNRDLNIHEGHDILIDLLKRLSLEKICLDDLANKVNMHSTDDMFAAIGAGDLKPMQVAHFAQRVAEPEEDQLDVEFDAAPQPHAAAANGEVNVLGVGNLLTQVANCCKPAPGDEIVGYITVGRGVSIHRKDCINALQLQSLEPGRIIEVSWGNTAQTYPVDVVVDAYDRPGLLHDVAALLANARINVNAANSATDKKRNTARIHLQIEVPGIDSLGRLFDRIRQLPNIIDARRDGASTH